MCRPLITFPLRNLDSKLLKKLLNFSLDVLQKVKISGEPNTRMNKTKYATDLRLIFGVVLYRKMLESDRVSLVC